MSEIETALESEKCAGSIHAWKLPAKEGDLCQCGESRFIPWEPTLRDVLSRLDWVQSKLEYLESRIDNGLCRYGEYD